MAMASCACWSSPVKSLLLPDHFWFLRNLTRVSNMAGMGMRDMSESGRRQRVLRVSSVTPGNVEEVLDVGGVALVVLVGGVTGLAHVEVVTVVDLLILTGATLLTLTGRLVYELEWVRLVPMSVEPDTVVRAVMGALDRPTLLVFRLRTGTLSILAADVARVEF